MDIAERVRELIHAAEDDVGIFFHTASKALESTGGPVLLGLVNDAVHAAELPGVPGPAKAAAVSTAVSEALVARGLPVIWNAIHLAREAVIAHMHQEAGIQPTDHAPVAEAEIKPVADQNGTESVEGAAS